MALPGRIAIYAKTFLETLAKRHADALEDLVEARVHKKGKPDEYRIGVDDGSAATIAITEDTPDEARLALLDLDVTADAVHRHSDIRMRALTTGHVRSTTGTSGDEADVLTATVLRETTVP